MISPVFKSFVPQWLAKILLFLLLLPNMVLFFLPVANTEVAAGYYGLQTNEISYMISLYYAGFASFYALERRFYSYFTYKRYFLTFQLIQILCCVVLFSSSNLLVLYAVRFFQGMLFASAVNLYLSMIALKIKTFRAKEASYSLFFGMLLCTSVFNNIITADLIDNFNFDFLFHLMIVAYALNIFVVLIMMKINIEIRSFPLVGLDVPSFILMAIFLISLGYCSVFGQQYYWLQSTEISIALGICLLSLALFTLRQLNLKRCYIDLKIVTYKKFIIGIIILFSLYICRFSISYSGQFFTQILGMDPRHNSYMYALNLLGIIVGVTYACIHLIKKRTVFLLWIPGFIFLFAYHFLMNQQLMFYANESTYYLPMFLQGIGLGFIMVPTILYCISSVPFYLAPSAAAFCLFVRFMGYTVSQMLTNYYTIYNSVLHRDRFLYKIQSSNPLYLERLQLIKQKLSLHGYSDGKLDLIASNLFQKELKQQVLLRSIMDYYTLMMYFSIAVIVFIVLFWMIEKKVAIKIRPILPI